MLEIRPYELYCIDTGHLKLDGGALFGVVPRVLWERHHVPDALNRIRLAMRVVLAVDRRAGRVILVDTGAGSKWSPQEIERFGLDTSGDLLGAGLRRRGVADEDVTDVIVTHLHFDHNGGLTVAADADSAVPRFARARHWVHAAQLAHARSPTLKDRASFFERDYAPVHRHGLFNILEGASPHSPFANVTWFMAHGHTPYQLLPRFSDGENAAQFVADLVPTAAHLAPAWIMAYDNEPLKTLEEKQRLIQDCQRERLILLFEHDPDVAAARIDPSPRHPAIAEEIDV